MFAPPYRCYELLEHLLIRARRERDALAFSDAGRARTLLRCISRTCSSACVHVCACSFMSMSLCFVSVCLSKSVGGCVGGWGGVVDGWMGGWVCLVVFIALYAKSPQKVRIFIWVDWICCYIFSFMQRSARWRRRGIFGKTIPGTLTGVQIPSAPPYLSYSAHKFLPEIITNHHEPARIWEIFQSTNNYEQSRTITNEHQKPQLIISEIFSHL